MTVNVFYRFATALCTGQRFAGPRTELAEGKYYKRTPVVQPVASRFITKPSRTTVMLKEYEPQATQFQTKSYHTVRTAPNFDL